MVGVKLHPWEYTTCEGGSFKPWKGGPVTREKLLRLKRNTPVVDAVVIEGIIVHCLIFESAAVGYGNYARWDCMNGWTTTLRTARRNFPNGLHATRLGRK